MESRGEGDAPLYGDAVVIESLELVSGDPENSLLRSGHKGLLA